MTFTPPATPVLLHVCCAPCSGAIIEALCSQGVRPTVFWSNSNILSADENVRRLAVLRPFAARFGVEVIEDEYDHADWLTFVRDQLEAEESHVRGRLGRQTPDLAGYPERGARCEMCFRYRLLRAARYAAANGFGCLTTSLASSRWKSLEQVDAAGSWAVARANAEAAGAGDHAAATVSWWPQNWRKGGLQERRSAIIREENFYNQTFCGCEFSLNHNPSGTCPATADTTESTNTKTI
ncbi:MAG: epoxyqueuosine reductase QueH [Bacteroidales bacterium]|nr:epoxyqueuosine reductase QueH [Bacteroidales bacterium]